MSGITTRTLSCGTPLIVESMSGVRSAALCWLLPAGAAYDPPQRQGAAAMLAELLLRGAGTLDSRAQADAFDRAGISRGTEVGGFTLRVGATLLGARVDDALPLIADMVLRPRLDAEAIGPSRDLALQAWASVKDDPQERAVLVAAGKHTTTAPAGSGHGPAAPTGGGGHRSQPRPGAAGAGEREGRPAGAGDAAGAGAPSPHAPGSLGVGDRGGVGGADEGGAGRYLAGAGTPGQ